MTIGLDAIAGAAIAGTADDRRVKAPRKRTMIAKADQTSVPEPR